MLVYRTYEFKEECLILKKLIVSALILTTLLSAPTSVEAQVATNVQTVEVQINSMDNAELIKTSIINTLALENKTIDINSIDINNTTLTLDKLDTTTLGDHLVNATINVKSLPNTLSVIDSSYCVKLNIRVVDNAAPVLELTQSHAVIKKDAEFNPWDYISFAFDNSHTYPEITLEHNVDVSTYGEYVVNYTAKDKSGNITNIDMPVTVSSNSYDLSNVTYNSDDIQYMLDLINEVRTSNGLNPYQLGDDLAQQAVAIRAQEAAGAISHTRPDGSHYKTAFDEIGVSYENHPLEILTYSGSTVEDKLNWWLNSSGHRSILMQPDYDYIALAYVGGLWCGIAY